MSFAKKRTIQFFALVVVLVAYQNCSNGMKGLNYSTIGNSKNNSSSNSVEGQPNANQAASPAASNSSSSAGAGTNSGNPTTGSNTSTSPSASSGNTTGACIPRQLWLKYPSIHSYFARPQTQTYLQNGSVASIDSKGYHDNNNYMAADALLKTVNRCYMQIEWNPICVSQPYQPSQYLNFNGVMAARSSGDPTIPTSFKFWLPAGAVQLVIPMFTYQNQPMYVVMRKGQPSTRTSPPTVAEINDFATRYPIIPNRDFSRFRKLLSGDEILSGAEGSGVLQTFIAGDILSPEQANPKGDWVYVSVYEGPSLELDISGKAVKSMFQSEFESMSYEANGDPKFNGPCAN